MCKKEEACEEVAGPVQRKGSPGPTLVSNSSLCGLRLSFNSSMFQISLLKNKGVGLDSFWELFYCECLQFTIVCLRKRERERERESVCVCVCVCTLSCVWFLCDPIDCSLPVFPVHGVLRQEYWSGLPFPPPGDLPTTRPSPALAGRSLPLCHQGSLHLLEYIMKHKDSLNFGTSLISLSFCLWAHTYLFRKLN